jgi:AraC family transcriptional regulator, exoenzyme S synthesis regulatory protein ExsA
MKITVLPKDLKIDESENLQLYDYRRTKDIQKTKINLSKNTISFLRTGTKEVTFKREFFKHYQKTPTKWFAEQRLNHVAFILKTKMNRPIELYFILLLCTLRIIILVK